MRTTAVLLVAAALLGASATPVALAEADQGELLGIAQRYLHARAQKVTTGPQTPGFGVADAGLRRPGHPGAGHETGRARDEARSGQGVGPHALPGCGGRDAR
ncbi:hypothetical protein AB0E59_47350 [Lentzea sp. NPDC034063]|uniref:hypothetical protein n=1 Tax=unclassified Lentzea TaxID=2643253 RepID=UPI0033FF52F1